MSVTEEELCYLCWSSHPLPGTEISLPIEEVAVEALPAAGSSRVAVRPYSVVQRSHN